MAVRLSAPMDGCGQSVGAGSGTKKACRMATVRLLEAVRSSCFKVILARPARYLTPTRQRGTLDTATAGAENPEQGEPVPTVEIPTPSREQAEVQDPLCHPRASRPVRSGPRPAGDDNKDQDNDLGDQGLGALNRRLPN